MLDHYTYEGAIEFETFTGPYFAPFHFTLFIAPGQDEELRQKAAMAVACFLVDATMDKECEGDT